MPRARRLLPFLALAIALLACSTLRQLTTLEGPEDLATDAFFPSATPALAATATPLPATATRPTDAATARPLEHATPTPTARPTLPAAFDDPALFRAAMRPEFASDVELFPNAARYYVEVTVTFDDDGSATLAGRERIRYTNPQTFALGELYLMLWPNGGPQYLSEMTLGRVTVGGAEVRPEMEHDGLAARLPLPAPLEPGASVDLSAEFEVRAFPGIADSGAARFGLTNGILLAPTFYPLIPRIVDGEWQTMPAPRGGDTTNSDTAFYLWRVTAPADLAVVATGTVIDSTTLTQTQTLTLVSGPMRDLALVVGPLELTRREVDGIMLNAYVLDHHAAFADDMLDYAEGQMKTLQEIVGPYPFGELDMVDAPGAFGGIEYPGAIFIGVVDGSDFFEEATVHEVGHQWFYSLIGDDQLLEPWLDEGAASYTQVLYFERVRGLSAANAALRDFWGYLDFTDHPELPIGLPVGEYPSEGDYAVIVYGKGALFFAALRSELGDETFFAFLRNYYDAYRYGFATAEDFQAAAEHTCACNLSDLFDLWVYKGGAIPRP
jgi:hypothetical protein